MLAAYHLIFDDADFEIAVSQASEHAESGNLVDFGVRPTGPEKGYGYPYVTGNTDGPELLKSFM